MKAKGRSRTYSTDEMLKRSYHSDVRKLKKWCRENDISLMSIDEAHPEDICVLSKSEYDIGVKAEYITEDNESYFLTSDNYETWENRSSLD